MKNPFKLLLVLILLAACNSTVQEKPDTAFETPYGSNDKVGKYITLNGAKLYYEEYGKGQPLLLIHGNSGSIQSMEKQIDYFKNKYRVIIADNRGQGKSELKTDSLTFNQITADWEALVNYLKLDSVNIVGWSDGGIIALKMGISGKTNIKKIVAMGANLRPDSTAVHAWAINHDKETLKEIKAKIKENDTTQNWDLQKQLVEMLLTQPNIPNTDLAKIRAQVLIMAGDEDITKNSHSVEMYESIPNAQLCIMPGETHYTPVSNPPFFNEIVGRFLSEPFKRPYSYF
jgi:pimeloyl-ACP methyl ester carboxylesterase